MTETFFWAGARLPDPLPLSSGHTHCPRSVGLLIGAVWGPMEAVQALRSHLCGLCWTARHLWVPLPSPARVRYPRLS